MSGILTGAALQRGPKTMRARLVLVAITDNADDYGFACVSLETIAEKALCVPKTVTRVLAELEHEGWMQIRRKAIGGRNNLYFVNLAKLGITPSERSRMSEWHRQVLGAEAAGQKTAAAKAAFPADTMSLGEAQHSFVSASSSAPQDIVSHGNGLPETVRKSGSGAEENSSAVEPAKGHFGHSQGTFSDAPRDISAFAIRKNVERRTLKTTPLPPDKRGEVGARSSVLSGSVEWANAGIVMQECNLADPRIRTAVTLAIANFCKRTDATAYDTAMLMVESYRTWTGMGAQLRYRWSPRKFFADGHWAQDWHAWPLVPELAARANRPGYL